jgi:hypothetical protein
MNIVNGLKEHIGSKLKVDLHGIVEPEVCHISIGVNLEDIGRSLLGEMR